MTVSDGIRLIPERTEKIQLYSKPFGPENKRMLALIFSLLGIILTLLWRESMPDSTLIWFVLFLLSLMIMVISEVRSYLRLHSKYREIRTKEQEAMINLIKDRLIPAEKATSDQIDQNKLAEQMANEIKSRMVRKTNN